jgi:hypothetical protein
MKGIPPGGTRTHIQITRTSPVDAHVAPLPVFIAPQSQIDLINSFLIGTTDSAQTTFQGALNKRTLEFARLLYFLAELLLRPDQETGFKRHKNVETKTTLLGGVSDVATKTFSHLQGYSLAQGY